MSFCMCLIVRKINMILIKTSIFVVFFRIHQIIICNSDLYEILHIYFHHINFEIFDYFSPHHHFNTLSPRKTCLSPKMR